MRSSVPNDLPSPHARLGPADWVVAQFQLAMIIMPRGVIVTVIAMARGDRDKLIQYGLQREHIQNRFSRKMRINVSLG